MGSFVFLFVLLGLVCVAWWKLDHYQKDKLLRGKSDYEKALFRLRNDPHDPELRAKALELGRRYSLLCRDGMGVAIFDEVALMNDLQAATTGQPRKPKSSSDSIEDRLERLESLRRKGYISDEQYESRKSKILDEL